MAKGADAGKIGQNRRISPDIARYRVISHIIAKYRGDDIVKGYGEGRDGSRSVGAEAVQPLVARVSFTFVFLTRRRGYQRATRGSLQSKVINAFTIIVFLILVKMITFLDKSDARVSYKMQKEPPSTLL